MSNIVKIRPDIDIDYYVNNDRIEAVSLVARKSKKDIRLYLGLKDEFGKCPIYFGSEYADIEPDLLKGLCIAWLALHSPECLKVD